EAKFDICSVQRTFPFTIYRGGFSSTPASIPAARGLGSAIPVWFVFCVQTVFIGFRIIGVIIPSTAVSSLPLSAFILSHGFIFIIQITPSLVVITTGVVESDVSILGISMDIKQPPMLRWV
ncbi:hypothetical protein B0H13DRAFT_2107542, partial [Mycena leptocephala]